MSLPIAKSIDHEMQGSSEEKDETTEMTIVTRGHPELGVSDSGSYGADYCAGSALTCFLCSDGQLHSARRLYLPLKHATDRQALLALY